MAKTNWRESVAEMEAGLTACLSALDQYEKQFSDTLNDPARSFPEAVDHVPTANDGWGERLAIAGERANQVEQLLNEQESIWKKFQLSLNEWRKTLEKGPTVQT
jgi:hypothetical protein